VGGAYPSTTPLPAYSEFEAASVGINARQAFSDAPSSIKQPNPASHIFYDPCEGVVNQRRLLISSTLQTRRAAQIRIS
jgi:hypothetical protein